MPPPLVVVAPSLPRTTAAGTSSLPLPLPSPSPLPLPPPPPPPPPPGELVLFHFNDVYELSPSKAEPVGGAARFATVLKRLRARAASAAAAPAPSLVLFSGDAISPSLLSTVLRGRHMVAALNAIGVEGGVIGNHDLDHGVPQFERLCGTDGAVTGVSGAAASPASAKPLSGAAASPAGAGTGAGTRVFSFPWLLSNVKVAASGRPLGEARETLVLEPRGGGPFARVGLIGLWEKDVIATLATVEPALLAFEPPADCARRLCAELCGAQRCDLVIALTHMRVPNDELLARAAVPGLDLILGGHDHDYCSNIADAQLAAPAGGATAVLYVKSGTDFRTLSEIRIAPVAMGEAPPGKEAGASVATAPADGLEQGELLGDFEWRRCGEAAAAAAPRALRFRVVKHSVVSRVPEDEEVAALVSGFNRQLDDRMEQVIGLSKVALDSRFAVVRTQECAVGNLVADLMRHVTNADIALLNSGTLRADAVVGPGILKMRDLVRLLPLQDAVATVLLPGQLLLTVLENGVAAWPKLEGRFLQVSGLRFSFDSNKPPGSRIVPGSVLVLSRPGASGTGAAAAGAGAVPPQPTPAPAAADAGIFVSSADEAPSDSDEEDSAAAGDESPVRRQSRAGGKAAAAAAATASASASTIVAAAAAAAGVARFVPLNLEASYVVAIKGYLLKGKDGFEAFRDPRVKVLVDEELGPILPVAFRNYFRHLSRLSGIGDGDANAAPAPRDELARQAGLPHRNRVRKVRVPSDRGALVAAFAAAASTSPHNAGSVGGAAEAPPALSPVRVPRDGDSSGESGDEDGGGGGGTTTATGLLGATPFASLPSSPLGAGGGDGGEGGGERSVAGGPSTPMARSTSSSTLADDAVRQQRRAWTEMKKRAGPSTSPSAWRLALAVNPKVEGRIENRSGV